MLELVDVTKTYDSAYGGGTLALDKVSLAFPSRGLVFVLGRSGSGKTTMLNILGGLDDPTEGEVYFRGERITRTEEYRRSHVGFVFQDFGLIPEYDVAANIKVALDLTGGKDGGRVDELLRRVGLVEDGLTMRHRRPNELSGGQKQRVAIARALVKDPDVILADEPTGALDSETGEQIYELLKELSADKLVIVVTHDRDAAEKYGDRVIELADGEVVSDGAPYVPTKEEGAPCAERKKKRGGLAPTRVLALGASGLLVRKVRLALSVLLAVFAFAVFGFSLTAVFSDTATAELRTMKEEGLTRFAVMSANVLQATAGNTSVSMGLPLTDRQVRVIEEYADGGTMVPAGTVWGLYKLTDHLSQRALAHLEAGNPYYIMGIREANSRRNYAEADPETGCADLGLTPDARFEDPSLCRFPTNRTEIAITDLTADMFIRSGGYRVSPESETEPIETPDDLIGKTLGEFTVCGVYSTEIDLDDYRVYDNDSLSLAGDLELETRVYGVQYSIATYSFVCEGFNEEGPDGYVLRLDDVARARALLDDLRYVDAIPEDAVEDEFMLALLGGEMTFAVNLRSAFTPLSDIARFFRNYVLIAFVVTAAVFAVFSALLLMNFMTVSLQARSYELGVLRALGAGRRDIFGICVTECLAVALIDFLLAMVATGVTSAIVNSYFGFAIFVPGLVSGGLLLAIVLIVSLASSFLPVLRVSSRTPAEALRV